MKTLIESPTKFSKRTIAPWLLIALSPVILAWSTSDPTDPGNLIQDWLRRYGIPITGVEIAVIGLAVWSGFRPISSLRDAPRWSWVTLGLLLAIAFGTALAAVHRNLALLHFQLWLTHALFGLSVACLAFAAPERIRALFWPALVVGLLAFTLALVLYVALIPDPASFYWLRFGFGVTNIRHLGYFATVGIAASVGLALTRRRIFPTLAASSAASIFFALAFWSGSRATAIASWTALLCALIWFRRLRTSRNIVIILACSGAGMLLSRLHSVPDGHFGLERITRASGRETLDSLTSGRLTVWRGTWDRVLDRPLFGHGQGQFKSVVPEARPLNIDHPHNSLLQIAFDWGLLGAICFTAMLLYLGWYCLKVIGQDPTRQLPPLLICASLMTMSLYDGALFFAYPIMMLTVALAWIAGTAQVCTAHEGTGRREPSFT